MIHYSPRATRLSHNGPRRQDATSDRRANQGPIVAPNVEVSDEHWNMDERICKGETECSFARPHGSLSLFRKSFQSEFRVPSVVAHHPNPNQLSPDVVEEMVREAIHIAPAKPATIKMEILGICEGLLDSNLKLCEKILSKLIREVVLPFQNLVQVCLNSPVVPNFHGGAARQRVGRK